MNRPTLSVKFLCSVVFLFVNLFHSWGQPGSLDSTFNGTGYAYTNSTGQYPFMAGFANAIQPDGKLLVGGRSSSTTYGKSNDAIILRYKENGSLDSGFGLGGIVRLFLGYNGAVFFSIALQPNGKIITLGTTALIGPNIITKGILARYDADGKIDSSFGVNGLIITDVITSTVKILNDGKILTLGSGVMAKYSSHGSLDSSFGINGIVNTSRYRSTERSFEVQDDGNIISAGYREYDLNNYGDLEVTRYLSDGQLDLSFNGQGYINISIDSFGAKAYSVKIQQDEKIIVAGTVNKRIYISPGRFNGSSDFVIIRFNKNGALDTSFGAKGIIINDVGAYQYDYPSSIALQSNDKILVSGSVNYMSGGEDGKYVLVRYLSNGSLDSSFAGAGIKIYNPRGTCYGMQLKNNRIYLSGLAYIDPNTPGAYTLAIQNDGIPISPTSVNVCQGVTSTNFASNLSGSAYQWQVSTDSLVFNNITNSSAYSGVNSSNLTINNIPSSWNGYQYRCVVDNGVSNLFTIRNSNFWTGSINTTWENPANWSCGVVPDAYTDVIINSGNITINSNSIIRSLIIKPGATLTVANGFKLTILH